MNKMLLSCLVSLAALLQISNAAAVVVENLYQVSVPISSHAVPQRQQAMVEACKQVLIKVSGNTAIEKLDKNNVVKNALTHVENYVQQYGYVANVPPNTGELLQVKFDPKGINNVIQQTGQKVWGEERPLVVLWLLQKTNSLLAQPTIMGKDTDSALSNALKMNAERRGLAIVMPMLDLQDMQHLTAADLNPLNVTAIKEASKRYNAEAIIVGQLTQEADGKWQSQWTLLQERGQKQWSSNQDNVAAIAQAVDETSGALLEHYAGIGEGKPVNKDHVEVTILKVSGLNDYAKVEAYLKQLAMVKSVQVIKVEPNSVVFDLTLNGDVQALTQAINLDKKLQAVATVNNEDSIEAANNHLTYQWQL